MRDVRPVFSPSASTPRLGELGEERVGIADGQALLGSRETSATVLGFDDDHEVVGHVGPGRLEVDDCGEAVP